MRVPTDGQTDTLTHKPIL